MSAFCCFGCYVSTYPWSMASYRLFFVYFFPLVVLLTNQFLSLIVVIRRVRTSVSNSKYPPLLQSIQDPCKFHLILCFTLCHEKQSIHWILAKKFMNSFFQFKLRSSNALCCFLVVTIRFLSQHLQINHIIC